ncbi:hypothetical protein BD414DRAFT_487725 [Trametes punicea]|nr:hypothetical protein BD414DRAFT_487725 [Trametes punicea]
MTTSKAPAINSSAFWGTSKTKSNKRNLRRKAIVLTANTYERAGKVLDVVGGARVQCSLSIPKEDHILRVTTLGWIQRIWAL